MLNEFSFVGFLINELLCLTKIDESFCPYLEAYGVLVFI